MTEEPILLFAYGTLQLPHVQQKLFGRGLDGRSDALAGYRLEDYVVAGVEDDEDSESVVKTAAGRRTVHRIIRKSGNPFDEVKGTVYAISAEQLNIADDYEIDGYERTQVRLKSGRSAWTYARSGSI
ncbi:MAG: gamma-glutamylcyclotransferase family protein [Sphingosinicella sp.]